MTDPTNAPRPTGQSSVIPVQTQQGRELIVWWIVVGVLVFGILVILGAWN